MKGAIGSILLISALFLSDPVSRTEVVGYWLTDTKDVVVRIYQQKDSTFAGDIVWLKDSLDIYKQPLRDVLNDEPTERSRLIKGLTVLYDFQWTDEMWRYGHYYNYKNGSTYNIKMTLDEEGNLRLTGYYGLLFFLGKTKVWTRVNDLKIYGLKQYR